MLLGFWFYFAAQRQCSFASTERLLCKSFLYCDRTCDRFLRTRKGTLASAFCVMVLFACANNLSLLAQTITLSNPLALRLRKQRIYRTKKAPLQVLLGFWFYFATQRQCSFASAERLLCKSFLHCDRTCDRSTNHRVVAHTDKTHHFDVCGNG